MRVGCFVAEAALYCLIVWLFDCLIDGRAASGSICKAGGPRSRVAACSRLPTAHLVGSRVPRDRGRAGARPSHVFVGSRVPRDCADAQGIPRPKAVREADALAGVRGPPASAVGHDGAWPSRAGRQSAIGCGCVPINLNLLNLTKPPHCMEVLQKRGEKHDKK